MHTYWPWAFTYTIVDYGVYTSFGYHTILRPISKSFLAIKDITKPLRQIGVKLWKIGSIQNQYSIVVYVLMSDRESKNPRPLIWHFIWRAKQNETTHLLWSFKKKYTFLGRHKGNVRSFVYCSLVSYLSKIYMCIH